MNLKELLSLCHHFCLSSPAEELEFIVTDESKETLDILSLTNNTEKNVAFKVSYSQVFLCN